MYDYTKFDFDKPIFTIDDIRRVNPQRDEMEQLTAIVHVDREKNGVVGYKDVTTAGILDAGTHARLSDHAGRDPLRMCGPGGQLLRPQVQYPGRRFPGLRRNGRCPFPQSPSSRPAD